MTKKDYEKIAKVLANEPTYGLRATDDYGKGVELAALVQSLSIMFMGDNPRFDLSRFLVACRHA